jgi:hypothetical protein
MDPQPVLHTPGYIYTSASQDIAFSPLAYEHALDFKPLTTGSLLDETFGRRILNNFERIIGDSTGQIGLVVISESTYSEGTRRRRILDCDEQLPVVSRRHGVGSTCIHS